MDRWELDLVTLLNVLWYRDFPYTRDRSDEKRMRAMYTAHINGLIKACADLMGFFVLFEHGRRTDAIIRNANDRAIAKIEIEWSQPFRDKVNEIEKLSEAASGDEAETYIFIGYSEKERLDQNLKAIERQWQHDDRHLIAVLIIYSLKRDRRELQDLSTFVIKSSKSEMIRNQKALPWDVPETRWFLANDRAKLQA